MELLPEYFNIASKLARKISLKTNVEYEDLFSEAISKIPRCMKNFKPEFGKPFEGYLNRSLHGYMINFIRDRSFYSQINRTELLLRQKALKYNSLEQAADRMGVDPEMLSSLVSRIADSKQFSQSEIDNRKNSFEKMTSENSYVAFFQSLPFSCAIAEDKYMNGLTITEMKTKYGKDWKQQLSALETKIRERAENYLA